MAQFAYQGRNREGKSVSGKLEGDSPEKIAVELMSRGIAPIKIEKSAASSGAGTNKRKGGFWTQDIGGPRKVDLSEKLMFCRQMYSLTRAGVPVTTGIKKLGEAARSQTMRDVLEGVSERISAGKNLAVAMKDFPNVFDGFFTSIVEVGESTGNLDKAFLHMAEQLSLDDKTRKRVSSATRYPIIVIVAVMIAIVVINIFVIPSFTSMFESFGAELPLQTKILIASSKFFLDYWPYMLSVLVIAIFALYSYLKTAKGKVTWDRLKLKIPIIGDILNRIVMTRYARTFSLLLQAGVPLLRCLQLVSQVVGNHYVKDKILGMGRGIESGESLTMVSKSSGLFTPLVLQMLEVGEEAGSIDQMLLEVAEFYDREVDYDLEHLSAMLEPVLLAVVAAIVLVLALGVFLPMWDMSSAAQSK